MVANLPVTYRKQIAVGHQSVVLKNADNADTANYGCDTESQMPVINSTTCIYTHVLHILG